jgi:predicted signal transduction protein with EAL and GGDEF domain
MGFGRLGGEELAAVLNDTSRDKAIAVVERIRGNFALTAQEVDNCPVGATVSIGLVHCETAATDIVELLAQADQTLYFAKERGRNRVDLCVPRYGDGAQERPRGDAGSPRSRGQQHGGLTPPQPEICKINHVFPADTSVADCR